MTDRAADNHFADSNFAVEDESDCAAAFDVGGTHLDTALINSRGKVLFHKREAIARKSQEAFINQLIRHNNAIQANTGSQNYQKIGLALPAVIDNGGKIIQAPNLPFLDGLNLLELLQQSFADIYHQDFNFKLCYDGTASVIASAWIGAGRGCSNLVTVIIGTGIGGGLLLEGQVIKGYNNVAGAFGWMRLEAGAEILTLEDLCSGKGLENRGRELVEYLRKLAPEEFAGSSAAKIIFDAAEKDNPRAAEFIAEMVDYLGTGLANLVSAVNPEMIVFGGSVGLRYQPYLKKLQKIIASRAQPVSGANISLKCTELNQHLGVIGAAGQHYFPGF